MRSSREDFSWVLSEEHVTKKGGSERYLTLLALKIGEEVNELECRQLLEAVKYKKMVLFESLQKGTQL